TPLLSAPHAADDGAGRPRGPRRLRLSLVASTTEGIVAEAVTAFSGGAVLTAWALYLGCTPWIVGILAAMPYVAQLVQLPAAWITSVAGPRRTALLAVTLSRQVLLPLIPLPFLPVSDGVKQSVLVVVALASAVLGVIGNNAWVAWMGELVPAALRGRYFGRRTALCTFGGSLAALGAGVALDGGKLSGLGGPTLAVLAALACLCGAVTTWLMSRQADVDGRAREPFDVGAALRPFTDPAARPVLLYQAMWNAAIGVSAAFYALHMVQNLGMGFALMALHGVGAAASRVLAGPLWGKAIDRFGATPVLLACSFGIFFIPLIWLLPTADFLWPLVLEAVLSGVPWSGHAVAAFALPLAVVPRRGDRSFSMALVTHHAIA
ncbi:MAG: MFS transporter, partial [Myxococcales bacterium]